MVCIVHFVRAQFTSDLPQYAQMSDLFRSAFGYLSGPSQGSASASVAPAEDEGNLGEIIHFPNTKSVKLTNLIAEGGFSYVFKGIDQSTGDFIAVKKILAPDEESRLAILQEKEFLSQFKNENIIQYFGHFVRNAKKLEEHYLAMEYCPISLPPPPLKLQHSVQVFAQVCRAVKYLHEFGIIHRDIKLENVLVGKDGVVKLVDFGSATMEKFYPQEDWPMAKRNSVEEQIAAKTTPMYRAPEMLDLWSNHPIDERVDLWALGCLLFTLNFGTHPFQDSNKLAITNANYSMPKNVSESGPIVSLIRGLLKVNPEERLSFGQIQEVLVSIGESQGFSVYAPLPFKPPPTSPLNTGGGIVNPLANLVQSQTAPSGGGGSLFSSIRGGAASLIKNIKEQSQQYLGPVGAPLQSGGGGSQLPPKPAHPPPPRPPSPHLPRKKSETIEFENREYEAVQLKPPRPTPPQRPVTPPSRPPPPPEPKVANLLDMNFDTPPPTEPLPPSIPDPSSLKNADLLGDLFGQNVNFPDPFWASQEGGGEKRSGGGGGGGAGALPNSNVDLLGDPLASILGRSVPTSNSNFSSQSFLQPNSSSSSSIPQSASFQNLNAQGLSGGFVADGGSGRLPKNSSSPNLLLSDLILDDIIGGGGVPSGGSSNPTLAQQPKPNYNRTQIFEEPQKKQNLNDVFGDILSSQGFGGGGSGAGGGRTINEMRKIELLGNPNVSPEQIKVGEWREGKKKNIRALLSSLHTITWEGCNWEETNMSQMITPAQVKKVYRKACLAIHPDKQMGEEWEELAKMIFVELNEAWAAFEDSQ